MKNYSEKNINDFADKLFSTANKVTAGHMSEPDNINEDKKKSFEIWANNVHNELSKIVNNHTLETNI